MIIFFFSSRRRHTRCSRDWSSDVCSSDLIPELAEEKVLGALGQGVEGVQTGREGQPLRPNQLLIVVREGHEMRTVACTVGRVILEVEPATDLRVPPIAQPARRVERRRDRKSTRLNSSHGYISYAVFC